MGTKDPVMGRAVPVLTVADVGATISWYQAKLGFWSDPFPENEPYVFAMLFRDEIEIMLQRLPGYQKPEIYQQREGGVWDVYIRMEGVKQLYEAINEVVPMLRPLHQQPYGCWEFEVRDPNGYVLVFSEPGE